MLYLAVAVVVAVLSLLDALSRLTPDAQFRDGRWFTSRTRRLREGVRTLTGRVVHEAGPPFVVATVRSELTPGLQSFAEVERTRTVRPFDLVVHGAGVSVRVDPENAQLLVREYTRTEDHELSDGRTQRSEISEINGGDYVRVKGLLERSFEVDAHTADPYRGAPEARWQIVAGSGARRVILYRTHGLEARRGRHIGVLVGVLELVVAIVLSFIVVRTIDFEATARTKDALVTNVSSRGEFVGGEATFEVDGIQRRCMLAPGDLPAFAAQRGRAIKIRYSLADPRDCRSAEASVLLTWQKIMVVAGGVLFITGVLLNRSFRREPQWREG